MSESHDPWEAARGSQREEVAGIWADRGAPPDRPPRRRNWLRIAAVTAALAAVAALIVFVLVPPLQEGGARERERAQAAQERLEAAERERLRREGMPVHVDGPAPRPGEPIGPLHERLLAAGEAAITTDAQGRVRSGEIDGPVAGTSCRTFPFTQGRTAQESDPGVVANRYQCTAFSRRFELDEVNGETGTAVIGQPYWLVVAYRTGALTFCKITPKAGEGGRSLATVPVDPECRDPLA